MSLELINLKKAYPEFNMHLSFSAKKGELLTLLGPSGCGKTTTLHLIAGFLTPDSGNILINRRSITDKAPHLRHIGVVFQDYALFPNLNVFGNIAFGLRMHRWDKVAINKRVNRLLELIRLPGYEGRIVTQLSGGEQQRVALARALAPDPQLLLLDEPLSALDAKLRKELRSEIKRIQRELNLTTVYVTHDQEEALAISDKIVVMESGKIEQIGTAFEIHNQPQSRFVADFMGVTNHVKSTIAVSDGSYSEADTPEGRFKVRYPEKLRAGTVSTIVFRPEKCRLISAETKPVYKNHPTQPRYNTLSGKVAASEYLGESTIVWVKTDRGSYTAKISGVFVGKENQGREKSKGPFLLQIGDPVNLYINPDDCWIVH